LIKKQQFSDPTSKLNVAFDSLEITTSLTENRQAEVENSEEFFLLRERKHLFTENQSKILNPEVANRGSLDEG